MQVIDDGKVAHILDAGVAHPFVMPVAAAFEGRLHQRQDEKHIRSEDARSHGLIDGTRAAAIQERSIQARAIEPQPCEKHGDRHEHGGGSTRRIVPEKTAFRARPASEAAGRVARQAGREKRSARRSNEPGDDGAEPAGSGFDAGATGTDSSTGMTFFPMRARPPIPSTVGSCVQGQYNLIQ